MTEPFDPVAFYRSQPWRHLSAVYRKAHSTCRRCGRKAEHVDHVIDIRTAPERRLDWRNLQALCQACHNAKTAADRIGQPLRPHGGCDIDGMPTDPRHPWLKARCNRDATAISRDSGPNATAAGGGGGVCNPGGQPAGSGAQSFSRAISDQGSLTGHET